MGQVGGAFVRLRPSLSAEDRSALELLGQQARDLADGVDRFLSNFAREPDDPPSLEETHD
jgi:hypothetical protein